MFIVQLPGVRHLEDYLSFSHLASNHAGTTEWDLGSNEDTEGLQLTSFQNPDAVTFKETLQYLSLFYSITASQYYRPQLIDTEGRNSETGTVTFLWVGEREELERYLSNGKFRSESHQG